MYKRQTTFKLRDAVICSCMAYRLNDGYLNQKISTYNEITEEVEIIKHSNKRIMFDNIHDMSNVTDADREMADKVISYCHGLSFKILSGVVLNDFENKMLNITNKEDVDPFHFGFIASLPSSYIRGMKRLSVEDQLREASGHVGYVGQIVELNVTVLRNVLSHQYNIYFVTGITNDNKAVFFSSHSPIETDKPLNIKGRVKSHRDNITHLNYVKVR